MKFLHAVVLFGAAVPCLLAAPAHAQLPAKPIRLVVSVGAGSAPDVIARRLADKLAPQIGQPVMVENRPGVSGILAADHVAKSQPDGSALALAMGSTLAIAPHVYRKLPYDTMKDLTPVVQLGSTPFVLLVNAADPAQNLAQFIARAKASPGSFSFSSFGNGTAAHLIGEELKRVAGIQMLHVPYKTSAIPDLMGGRINASVTDLGSARPFLGGKIRALAVTGPHRYAAYPDIPTFGELGFPSFAAMVGWVGLFVPTGTPGPVVERLAKDIGAVALGDDMRNTMALLGYEPTGQATQAFAQTVRRDHGRWGQLVQDIGGITLD